MRFLLDENLSPLLAQLLHEAGHQAAHVRDLGMAGAEHLEAGSIVAFDEGRIRLRRLPI